MKCLSESENNLKELMCKSVHERHGFVCVMYIFFLLKAITDG